MMLLKSVPSLRIRSTGQFKHLLYTYRFPLDTAVRGFRSGFLILAVIVTVAARGFLANTAVQHCRDSFLLEYINYSQIVARDEE